MIKDILIRTFGRPKRDSGNGFSFNCPRCAEIHNNGKSDNKFNLEVTINNKDKRFRFKNIFHCWKCDYSGSLHKLIRKYSSDVDYELYTELDSEVTQIYKEEYVEVEELTLPNNFISFIGDKFDMYDQLHLEAFNYLKERGVDWETIKQFNIGFCLDDRESKYRNRIVIPSYNSNGRLNFFITRAYRKSKYKYLNPKIPKTEFIFNEKNINWNTTVFIVEGIFDLFTMPPNTILLLGKTLHENIASKIIKYKPNVIICLDSDAFKDYYSGNTPKSSVGIYNYLKSYGVNNVKVLELKKEDLNYHYTKGGKDKIIDLLMNNVRDVSVLND